MTQWFTIARVLPERLGLNGSSASAEIVAMTLRQMGHEVSIVDIHGPQDAPGTVDIVTVGSGSTSQISPAATELIGLVRLFQSWKQSGAYWIALGLGWDLLGEALITAGGDAVPGAGVFPSRADHRTGRFAGEVHGLDYRGRESAGYINQVGTTEILEGQSLVTLQSPPRVYRWPRVCEVTTFLRRDWADQLLPLTPIGPWISPQMFSSREAWSRRLASFTSGWIPLPPRPEAELFAGCGLVDKATRNVVSHRGDNFIPNCSRPPGPVFRSR